MDTLGPTPEQRRHDVYEAPETSQSRKQTAFRRLPIWEREFRNGALTQEQMRAAERYHRAWHGRDGADVRSEPGGIPRDPDYPAREAFGDQLRHAQLYVRDRHIWDLVEEFCVMETELEDIGRRLHHSKTPAILRAYAASRITFGLDRIAEAWGIAQTARSRERAA
jgi:hypothetical protein